MKPRINKQAPQEAPPLPSAPDSERALISSVLQYPACIGKLKSFKDESFHTPSYKTIWVVCREMFQAGELINSITVSQKLTDLGLIQQIGGNGIVDGILGTVSTGLEFRSYADIVEDKAQRRAMIVAGNELAREAMQDNSRKPLELLQEHDFKLHIIRGKNSTVPTFTDLTPFIDGTAKQEVPTIAEAWPGQSLFYAGRVNEIHAEPATGKTNVLVASSVQVLGAGGSVLYIDPEDTPERFVNQMRAFGASTDDIRERVKYLHTPSAEDIRAAQTWAKQNHPEIVILDGLAVAMSAQGFNENEATDCIAFSQQNLRPFAAAGAAVVVADHVTKSAENRGQFARGSSAKAGEYTGVSYEIVAGKNYTPTIEGFVKLKIQKDRNGGVGPRNKIVAELHFTPNAGAKGGTITTFREPADKQEGPFRPTAIMEKIVRHLEVVGEATKTELRSCGKAEYVDKALALLIEDRKISMRSEGKKNLYFLINKGKKP